MAALLGLYQLLRVAQQNKASSSRCTGQHISQRHLARLVDKEDVDGLHDIRARPQPWSAAEHLYGTTLQVLQSFVIRPDLTNRPAAGTIPLHPVCASYPSNVHLTGSLEDLIQQLADDFVSDGGDAHLLSVIHQLADHARARECLARSGRTLNGKH